ncbi:MAG: MBL fold metallo-hydrolase [Gemmatimonadales bacterium]
MTHTTRHVALTLFFAGAVSVHAPDIALAQQEMEDVQITTTAVAPGVYMLQGRGGNLGLSVGDDGAFLVDDQYAPLTEKILTAIGEVTDKPVRFVINTHWHGDHTGGNENMGKAGAIIVAHENVRYRMSSEQFLEAFNNRVPPSPPAALPVITFTDAITFHWNGDDIHVFHVHPAHTDGDAIIHFTRSNVIHMGDTYFNGMYPFIDVSTGGTIHGIIAAADQVLALTDAETKIIPGHGPLSNAEELTVYRDMLIEVRNRVAKLIAEGKTRDEVIAAKPTADLDATWGGGFMQPDVWVGLVYDGMMEGG